MCRHPKTYLSGLNKLFKRGTEIMEENTKALEEIKLLVLSSEKLVLQKKKLKDLMCKTLRNQINNLKGEVK